MEDINYFVDEEGVLWSVTKGEILRDVKDYELDGEETVDDPWQFFLDNIDESVAEFVFVSSPESPEGPQYRNPKLCDKFGRLK